MQNNPVSFWNALTVFCLSVHQRDQLSYGKILPNLPPVACHIHGSDLSFPVCGSDIAKLTCGNVTYTWFYRCFIIDKCPSLAINPVDTITLTLLFFLTFLNIQTCLRTFIVYFDYAGTILKNIAIFCFCAIHSVIWKNTEISTRLFE